MGYTTTFTGQFDLSSPLTSAHAAYLRQFAKTRRMKRNPVIAVQLSDPIREAVELPIGEEAGYFVGGKGFMGQDNDASIIDHNREPRNQPDLWCKWEPNEEGTAIIWNGMEKFYAYTEWLEYLIGHFLKPWGYILNGSMKWQGESKSDRGTIIVKNNEVVALKDGSPTNIKDLIEEALETDGKAHKQWYLWKIAEILGLDMDDVDADSGIAP